MPLARFLIRNFLSYSAGLIVGLINWWLNIAYFTWGKPINQLRSLVLISTFSALFINAVLYALICSVDLLVQSYDSKIPLRSFLIINAIVYIFAVAAVIFTNSHHSGFYVPNERWFSNLIGLVVLIIPPICSSLACRQFLEHRFRP